MLVLDFPSIKRRLIGAGIMAIILSVLPINALTVNAWAQDFDSLAPHAIIMDYESGEILYEKDARKSVAPASMTKIMTAELVFEKIRKGEISLDTEFTVSEGAWRRGGTSSGSSTMFLDPKSKVRVEDLLRGVIIQSGNDACIVLAEGIAGSESLFADAMTQHAKNIGLESATFKNATGWPDPAHRISTKDLARLARYTITNSPEFYPFYSEKSFTWNKIKQPNRNPLLGSFAGADGLKTGHTEISGYGLVGSAERNNIRRIIVINGLESQSARRQEADRMMQAAFERFKVYNLYESGETVSEIKVYMGKSETVSIGVENPVVLGLARSKRDGLKTQIRYIEPAAPILTGDTLAELVISAPGRDEQVIPLIALEDVKEKSAMQKVISVLLSKIRG